LEKIFEVDFQVVKIRSNFCGLFVLWRQFEIRLGACGLVISLNC
jgi:hypothetical protein